MSIPFWVQPAIGWFDHMSTDQYRLWHPRDEGIVPVHESLKHTHSSLPDYEEYQVRRDAEAERVK